MGCKMDQPPIKLPCKYVNLKHFLVCKERFATSGTLKRHMEQKKRSCMEKPVGTRCMFCGYGPSGEEFENRWRLSEHALGKLCHSIMQFQWSSTDQQQVRARGQLLLPTERNVKNLISERHLNSFARLLERDSNRLGWMPTLDQVNKTRIANAKPPLDSLPAVRETNESAAQEDPIPSAQEDPAATQLLTVTGDPLPFIDISSSANTVTVKSHIYFNFPSESCNSMMKNRPALDACFDAASTSSIEFVKVLLARDVENSLPQLSGDIPVIKVQVPQNLTGLRSTIPSSCIRQPFKDCLLSLGNCNQMISHPLSVRHYGDDGKEKIKKQTFQQFVDSLGGPNPLNVIDCFPPGLFSQIVEFFVQSRPLILLKHLKTENFFLETAIDKQICLFPFFPKMFCLFISEDAALCDFELPAVMKGVSLYHQFLEKLPRSLIHNSLDKYLLLTEKGAITPWHVDFSGTSVFYLLVRGQKEFLVIEPTPENMRKYSDFKRDKM